MKRFSVGLAVLVLAAAGVAAAAATGTTGTSGTVKVDAKLTTTKRIDSAPPGYSAGDRSLATGNLFAARSKRMVGRILLDCVDMPAQAGECAVTLALTGGHIAVLASYGKGFSGESSAHDPIVGGTGAYRTARGYTDEVETGDGAMTFTLHLER
ncbi:MAG: hypothetical protein ACXVVQ_15760 [Solirubrobacteraceae bacterium]